MAERANPFPGPRPFESGEAHLFFGRDREARQLVSLVFANRVLILHAPSGAGKSSFVRAKVVPSLSSEGFQVLGPARVAAPTAVGETAGTNPFTRNAVACCTPDSAGRISGTLRNALERIPPLENEDGDILPRVLILDQFEEIFRVPPERRDDRTRFFEELADALTAERQLRLVMVLREDFLAELESYIVVLPDRPAMRYRLDRLSRDAALLAITKPVQAGGRRFLPGVAEMLVGKLMASPAEGEFVEPVQLQVVCHSLWARLPEDVDAITDVHIQEFGDVDQTLARFYEECLRAALAGSPVPEPVLRAWFESAMITPQRTRGMAFRGPADTEGVPNAVVERLEDRHLIRGEFRANARWYELTHDRFIDPILLANQRWREQRPDAEQTGQWLEQRATVFPPRALDEGELARAEHWLAHSGVVPGPSVMALLEISRSEQGRRRERILYLEHQAASARKLRILAIACIVVALLAVGGAFWASAAQRRAEDSERAARAAQLRALQGLEREQRQADKLKATNTELDQQRASLNDANVTLNQRNDELRRQKRAADEARNDLQIANNNLSKQQGEIRQANESLLTANAKLNEQRLIAEASEARAVEAGNAASKALKDLQAETENTKRLRRIADSSNASDLARLQVSGNPRGAFSYALAALSSLFEANHVATAKVLSALGEVLPGAMQASATQSTYGPISAVVFSAAGDSIRFVTTEGNAFAWPFAGPSDPARVNSPAPGGPPDAVAISADGTKVVISRIDKSRHAMLGILGKGVIEEIDQLSPAKSAAHRTHRHALLSLAVSPDGKHVAGGSSFGYRYLWNFESRRFFTGYRRWRTPGISNWLRIVISGVDVRPATAFAFAPDPRKELFAIGGSDGKVEVRDFNGKLLDQWSGDGAILALAFSSDGRYVASGSRSRAVRIKPVGAGSAIVLDRASHGDAVLSVAFSPDAPDLFATGGQEGIVRLWRFDPKGQRAVLLLEMPKVNGHVESLTFGATNHLLAAATSEGKVVLWDMRLLPRIEALKSRIARAQSGLTGEAEVPVSEAEIRGIIDECRRLQPSLSANASAR